MNKGLGIHLATKHKEAHNAAIDNHAKSQRWGEKRGGS